MTFNFTEEVTIEFPNLDKKNLHFSESSFSDSNKLVVELAAIHEGLTANYNFYGSKQLESALGSWVSPYPKPIILNHDREVNPIGRVMAAKMDQESSDDTPFVRLQIAITDQEAIQRVLDDRYMTGSVGGAAKEAKCSICGKDWAEASIFDAPPCKHQRGKIYNGKLASMELGEISFKEYSFVNVPADQRSMILQKSKDAGGQSADTSDGWIRSARVFALNMDKESIVEFCESAEDPIDTLSGMKKKDAHFTYNNLKGAWLSVTSYDYLDNEEENITSYKNNATIDKDSGEKPTSITLNAEERNMSTKEETESAEEDLIAVIGQLSEDLASDSSSEQEDNDSPEALETSASEEQDEQVSDEVTDQEETPEESEETSDTDTSDAQDVSEESEELTEDNSIISDESGEETEESTPEDPKAEGQEDENPIPESKEADGGNEGINVEALTSELEQLRETNTQLKKMLHVMLAERVVDKKVDVGDLPAEDRATALEEHVVRSASSLADNLKDLQKRPVKPSRFSIEDIAELDLSGRSPHATGSEPVGTLEAEEAVDPEVAAIDMFTDVLMGRRKL